MLRRLWEDAAHEHAKEGAAKCWYAFNKAAAYCLRYGVEEDYRLSMQHLYAAEAAAQSGGVMELQCLTPRTSLQIGSGKGTYRERALLAASLQNGRQLLADREIAAKFVGEADAQRFAEEFASFERRLRAAALPRSALRSSVSISARLRCPTSAGRSSAAILLTASGSTSSCSTNFRTMKRF